MRDSCLPMSILWARQAKFSALRGIQLYNVAYKMLSDLPADKRAYWEDELAGVDKRVQTLYYGHSSTNNNTT